MCLVEDGGSPFSSDRILPWIALSIASFSIIRSTDACMNQEPDQNRRCAVRSNVSGRRLETWIPLYSIASIQRLFWLNLFVPVIEHTLNLIAHSFLESLPEICETRHMIGR
jgi:hypothetical protein